MNIDAELQFAHPNGHRLACDDMDGLDLSHRERHYMSANSVPVE